MTIHFRRARAHLENFDFKNLFVEELGWGRAAGRPSVVAVDGGNFRLTPMAELGGMIVFGCEANDVPAANIRKKIDKEVSKLAFEHIIIFTDAARTKAVWLWVKRAAGKAAKPRENTYRKGESGTLLLQKLAGIAFQIEELDDEGRASIADVAGKVAKAFDVERVTKRFYDQFKEEHTAFLRFVKGIDDAADRAWYASVMLNRLMFIYFIQRKGFLDGDRDYLLNKLKQSKEKGRDRYYRDFLVTLFFDGFAQEESERTAAARKLLGDIPYLNGGLFLRHSLEDKYGLTPTPGPSPVALRESADKGGGIQILDSMFERLFKFFNQWDWHLDDRPPEIRKENEVNPDVLGYIFEKYVNQKQMGAYYTKEDITGYICRSTILPFLLDKLDRLSDPDRALPIPDLDQYLRPSDRDPLPLDRIGEYLNPKARQSAVFPLKEIDPYIYPAVKTADYLPTETEREYAARQQRLAQIRADFKAGKINSVNDLITYNLDIERVVADWLKNLSSPITLRAFYFECLTKLTVLDPTVGSGAFLFAAMNILEPLYESCLDKMAEYAGPKYPDFEAELARIKTRPNRRYFIFKSIIVNNLYGVDIMEEATEICKLRLFLKLVAQVPEGDSDKIEPLPDIDFNIRAGNTLVGYASLAEVEEAAKRSLFNVNLPQRIKEADIALRAFRDLQTRVGVSARTLAKAKSDTQTKLAEIESDLNESLRAEYGARSKEKFVASHHPFHWYVEFNQIMQDGGFDVIVGNPPYVEYKDLRQEYQVRGFETEECGDLYAFVMERSASSLLREGGRLGMIVPVSSISTDGFHKLQTLLLGLGEINWISSYAERPSKLFVGVEKRLSIVLQAMANAQSQRVMVSRYHRWLAEERPHLFERLEYIDATAVYQRTSRVFPASVPKVARAVESSILARLFESTKIVNDYLVEDGRAQVLYTRKLRYFVQFFDFVPEIYDARGKLQPPSELKSLNVPTDEEKRLLIAILNSSLFFWFFVAFSDCRNVNRREIINFPVDLGKMKVAAKRDLVALSQRLMKDFQKNSDTLELSYANRGKLRIQTFQPRLSKPIIDEIDRVLARHYGFTDEELDFIINYDIKYRMGREEGVNE